MIKIWKQLGQSSLSTGVAASYANTMVAFGTNLVAVPIYVHLLKKEEYGLLLTVMSLTAYLPLLNLGINRTTSNRFAEAHAMGDVKRANCILATGFWTYVRITAVALAAVLVAVWMLPIQGLFRGFHDVQRIRPFVSVAAVMLLIEMPLTVFPSCLRATGHISKQQNLLSAQLLMRFAGSVMALELRADIIILVALLGAINICFDCVQLRALRARVDDIRFGMRLWNRVLARELRAPSAYYLLLDIAAIVLFGCDAIVISVSLGTAAVTSYVLAQRVIVMAWTVPTEIANNFGPRFIQDWGTGDRAALQRDFARVWSLCLWVGAALVLLLTVGGHSFLDFWVGSSNYVGNGAFRIMLILLALQVVLNPIDTLLVVLTRHKRYALGIAVEACLNLVLSMILVHSMGVAGVALGTVLARLLAATPVMLVEARKILGDVMRRFARQAARVVVPPLAMTCLLVAVASPSPEGVLRLILWTSTLGSTYVLATFILSRRSFLAIVWSASSPR